MKVFKVSENGFSMDDNTVAVPACEITAESYLEAAAMLTRFLETRELPATIKLVTPWERIKF